MIITINTKEDTVDDIRRAIQMLRTYTGDRQTKTDDKERSEPVNDPQVTENFAAVFGAMESESQKKKEEFDLNNIIPY